MTIAEPPTTEIVDSMTGETVKTLTIDPKSPWVNDVPVSDNRYTGRYTGRGVVDFQHWFFRQNQIGFRSVAADGTVRKIHMTDYQIAIMWAVEFPRAVDYMADVARYVGGTRTLINRGVHNKNYPAPKTPYVTYGVDGKPAKRGYSGPKR